MGETKPIRQPRWMSKKREAEKKRRQAEQKKKDLEEKQQMALFPTRWPKKSSTNEPAFDANERKKKRSIEKLLILEKRGVQEKKTTSVDSPRAHVEMIRMQDRVKKNSRTMVYTNYKYKTDKEMIDHAQEILSLLKEKQKIQREAFENKGEINNEGRNMEEKTVCNLSQTKKHATRIKCKTRKVASTTHGQDLKTKINE